MLSLSRLIPWVRSQTPIQGRIEEKHTLVGGGIVVLPSLQELEELLGTAFLKETHQRAPDGLHFRAGNLRNFSIAIDEAARDLLELEITGNIGVHEDLGQLPRGNNEFRDKIDGVVAVASKLGGGLLIGAEFAIELWALSDLSLRVQRSHGSKPG